MIGETGGSFAGRIWPSTPSHAKTFHSARHLLKNDSASWNCAPTRSAIVLSAAEDPTTIEFVVEPFLLKEGFLTRTPRGRTATARAHAHFGRTPR